MEATVKGDAENGAGVIPFGPDSKTPRFASSVQTPGKVLRAATAKLETPAACGSDDVAPNGAFFFGGKMPAGVATTFALGAKTPKFGASDGGWGGGAMGAKTPRFEAGAQTPGGPTSAAVNAKTPRAAGSKSPGGEATPFAGLRPRPDSSARRGAEASAAGPRRRLPEEGDVARDKISKRLPTRQQRPLPGWACPHRVTPEWPPPPTLARAKAAVAGASHGRGGGVQAFVSELWACLVATLAQWRLVLQRSPYAARDVLALGVVRLRHVTLADVQRGWRDGKQVHAWVILILSVVRRARGGGGGGAL
jgi:hypothetical protein